MPPLSHHLLGSAGRCSRAFIHPFISPKDAFHSKISPLRAAWTAHRRPASSRAVHSLASIDQPASREANERLYNLALSLSHTQSNSSRQVQCIFYDEAGTCTSTQKLTKDAIADMFSLTTRDLRTVDLPSAGFPHILIREHSILVHIFDLRLIIQAHKTVLFDVDEDVGREHDDNTSRIFSHNIGAKLITVSKQGTPYELRVLEIALAAVTSTLEAQYVIGKAQIKELLATLNEDSIIQFELRTLLEHVRKLAAIEQRARHVRDTVQAVLDDDADMAAMYLTDKKAGKAHAQEDHQSVEYMLEATQKASDAVVQQTSGLLADVKRTEETIQSILNVRRNEILVLEAQIEIFMVGLASATLVAGLYGMNVVNYFEESVYAFGVLSAMCVFGTAVIWRLGLRKLRRISRFKSRRR